MNKKLYVGNLSYATTEEDLKALFSEIGPVTSVVIITDRSTGQSKGFGFVEMETTKAAQAAIERLHSHELNERTINVSEARPPRERTYGDGGGRRNDYGGGGGRGGSSRSSGGSGGSRRRY